MKVIRLSEAYKVLKESDGFDLPEAFEKYMAESNPQKKEMIKNLIIAMFGEDKFKGYERYKLGNFKDSHSGIDFFGTGRQLNISGKGIDDLTDRIGDLVHIEELNAENNQIDYIPPSISNLTKLKELDLSRNLLTALPFEIGKLEALRVLSINNNRLKELPTSIGNLGALYSFGAANNFLKELPRTITNCEHLKFLWLTNNKLQRFPEGFEEMNLTQVDVSDNPMSFEYIEEMRDKMPHTTIVFNKQSSGGDTFF